MRQTYMAKASEVERNWVVLDATDIPLGRLAAVAASMLRGKNKPTFTPNVDTGDYVIIVNAEKVKLTGIVCPTIGPGNQLCYATIVEVNGGKETCVKLIWQKLVKLNVTGLF